MTTSGIYFPKSYTPDDIASIRRRLARIAEGLGLGGSAGELLASIAFGDLEVGPPSPKLPPTAPRPDFIQALAELLEVAPGAVQEALAYAAAQVVEGQPAPIRIYRSISAETGEPSLLTIESQDESMSIILDDVGTLRALLCTLDEDAPAQPGEAYTTPVRLGDGRVVSRVEG